MRYIFNIIPNSIQINWWLIVFIISLGFTRIQAQKYSPEFNVFKAKYENKLNEENNTRLQYLEQYIGSFSVEVENKIVEKYIADNLLDLGESKKADSLYRLLIPWFKTEKEHNQLLSAYSNRGRILYQTGQITEVLKLTDEALAYISANQSQLQSEELQIYISEIYRNIAIAYAIQSERDNGVSVETSEGYFRKR